MCATQPIARTVRAAADKEENRGKPRFCFYMPVHEASTGLFGTGQHLSRHRVSEAYELRKRVRPDGAAPFLHRLSGVRELPQAGSPFPGGKVFAEPQRGIALCGARETAAPAAGAKRKGHLRFPFLFGLLPFPGIVWRRLPICDRCEIGERQRIFSSVSFAAYSQGQIVFCYTGRLLPAGATYPCRAIRERFVIDSTCEDK